MPRKAHILKLDQQLRGPVTWGEILQRTELNAKYLGQMQQIYRADNTSQDLTEFSFWNFQ